MCPSSDGQVSQLSLQSNDSNNVGKSGMGGKSSDAPQHNISSLSAGISSSHVEADGSQNEGKRNDEPSAQQEGQSLVVMEVIRVGIAIRLLTVVSTAIRRGVV